MKKQALIILLVSSAFFSFSQFDYKEMKDTICPSICGIRDSSEVGRIYRVLLSLDTTKITSGMADYYEDLSHVQYDLCLWNNEDSTYQRLSLQSTEKSLYHNPKNERMLWNAAFGYTVFKDCDKTHYYLQRYYDICPKKYWKVKAQKEQIGILLSMCPNEELKKKFHII